jgi:hypothetical protein
MACTEPQKMLEFLRGKASDRKLRLFAVACSCPFAHLTGDPRVGQALDVAERFADGLIGDLERSNARKTAQQSAQSRPFWGPRAPKWERRVASLAYWAAARQAMEAAWNVPQLAVEVLVWRAGEYTSGNGQAITTKEAAIHADLLREIFVNPFGPRPEINPAWLTWQGGTIPRIAQAIYDERAFDRLPVLADALEEAACNNPDILAHCRGPGPHVRGCWVVDLLVGKK